MGECADGDLLDQVVFRHSPRDLGFQRRILVLQTVTGLLGLQLGTHPGLNDHRFDGLGDVISGAEGEAELLALGVGEGGEQNDGNTAADRGLTQLPEHFITIHAGHHHIQQDEVRLWIRADDAQAFFPALRSQHAVMRRKQFGQYHQIFG